MRIQIRKIFLIVILKLRAYRLLPLVFAGVLMGSAAWPAVVHVCSMTGHGMHAGLVDCCCPPAPVVPTGPDEEPCHGGTAAVTHGENTTDGCCSVTVSDREAGLSAERAELPARVVVALQTPSESPLEGTHLQIPATWLIPEPASPRPPSLHILHGSFLI